MGLNPLGARPHPVWCLGTYFGSKGYARVGIRDASTKAGEGASKKRKMTCACINDGFFWPIAAMKEMHRG